MILPQEKREINTKKPVIKDVKPSMKERKLTLWRRNYFFNFSTPCIENVNNKGTKQTTF